MATERILGHHGLMTDPVLAEIMGALEMPPEGLKQWFSHLEDFCRKHGGDRTYSDLLKLIAECQQECKTTHEP